MSHAVSCGFLSTPSARRATTDGAGSIRTQQNFYPRPPRGGRQSGRTCSNATGRFLSTPSARRATILMLILLWITCYFYPRPPRGGRPEALLQLCRVPDFYPRPPRGGRQKLYGNDKKRYQFLSTPSARRATCDGLHHHLYRAHFYPRPPRGGRLDDATSIYQDTDFYPRPPRGGRHSAEAARNRAWQISIHALREEGD